jgi:CheY-like chemotaxis protein
MTGNPATRWVAQSLRQALRNLYDPAELRRSPLIEALRLDQSDGSFALHQLLLDSISALQPSRGISPQSDAWRTYQILYHHYVDQFSQTEVAASIGVSERQLRRLERLALETLAEYLRAHHSIAIPLHAEPAVMEGEDEEVGNNIASSPVLLAQEARVLEQFSPSEPVNVHATVKAALETLSPLFDSQQVCADCLELDTRLNAAAHPASFRQALLIVLATATRSARGGHVVITAHALPSEVCLDVCPQCSVAGLPYTANLNDLQMARELIALSNGRLEVESIEADDTHYVIHMILPGVARKVVLAIDDNADALQLLGRYMVGTAYLFAGLRDPLRAIELADRLQPLLIMLDVMLPGIDGWEVLARLREHPRTRGIPVIIYTVLPQEQLALSLGAAGFLRKPVKREDLLALLEGLILR